VDPCVDKTTGQRAEAHAADFAQPALNPHVQGSNPWGFNRPQSVGSLKPISTTPTARLGAPRARNMEPSHAHSSLSSWAIGSSVLLITPARGRSDRLDRSHDMAVPGPICEGRGD
jgi:hypothetical protein